jgi:hypothetical protein
MKGINRITFEGTEDVLITNSDARRSTYWKAEGQHFSLHLAHQTRVTRCVIGEPLGILALTFGGVLPAGVVASIEPSYHSVYSPESPTLFGPNVDYKPLSEDELRAIQEDLGIR